MNDRNYYRTLPVRALIEAARDSGHELAIALGERLAERLVEVERDLEDALNQNIYEG